MDTTLIDVDKVNKSFYLPHEKQTSIKNLFINVFKGKKSFEHQHVLKDISFKVNQGDFFGIVGRNGSGKSTLLKLLAGIYYPNSGDIKVNANLTPFIELGVGFNQELSGRENVFLNGALLGFNRVEMSDMYEDIVKFAELGRFMDQKLKNYSSGMQVRLAFSIAIRARSDILLLDEVLAVGDSAFQQKCFRYFEKLKKENKTVVFVSHDMSSVTRFCNKAIYLKNGRLTHSGTASEIADIYKLENIEAPSHTGLKLSKQYELIVEMTKKSDGKIVFNFKYKSQDETKMYIGFSILREGISIAELTTQPSKPLSGDGSVSYTFDTIQLNEGVYQLNAVLSRTKDRKLLAINSNAVKFSVKREDNTRGSSINLSDNWTY